MLFVETLAGIVARILEFDNPLLELFVHGLVGVAAGAALYGVIQLFRYVNWSKNIRSTPFWNKIPRRLWMRIDAARRTATKCTRRAKWNKVYKEDLTNFARSCADAFIVEENEISMRLAQILSNLFFDIQDKRFSAVENFTLVARDKKLLCVLEGEVLDTDSIIAVVSQTEITESFITPLWMSIMDKILQLQKEKKL